MAANNQRPSTDLQQLDAVFRATLSALEQGREQTYAIAEAAREEYRRVEALLAEVKREATQCVETVDRLDLKSRAARARLKKMNEDFRGHTPEEIRKAYAEAEDLQVKLAVAQQQERILRQRRDELERSLRNVEAMVSRAQEMLSQLSLAGEYLTGGVSELHTGMSKLRAQARMGHGVIKSQEDERQQVARDLHDGPAQILANVVLRTEICERLVDEDREQLQRELAGLKDLVKQSLQTLRRIMFDLRPMALDDLGLVPALRRYVGRLREEQQLDLQLRVSGREVRLSPAAELTLFRVVQEAVENACRHAQARQVTVDVQFGQEAVRLVIEDDGVGFDLDEVQARHGDHVGLTRIRERVMLLAGDLEVQTSPGSGTRVLTAIPRDNGVLETKKESPEVS